MHEWMKRLGSIGTRTNPGYSTTWVKVTPELATAWLEFNIGNRRLTNFNVESLIHDMNNDNWIPGGGVVRFDWNGRLIDGQHTLTAIVRSATTQVVLVVGELDPLVQSVIDTNKKRSAANTIEFMLGGEASNTNLVAAIARVDIAIETSKKLGRRYGDRGPGVIDASTHVMSNRQVTNRDVADWVASNEDVFEAATLSHMVVWKKRSKGEWGVKVTPRAAGWLLLHFARNSDAVIARNFFISTDNDLRETESGDPRVAFRDFCARTTGTRGNDNVMHEIIAGVYAWNAWRRDLDLRLIRLNPTPKEGSGQKPMALQEIMKVLPDHGDAR